MSIEVATYVWRNSKHKGTDLLLLLAIADHSNGDGQCWPSIARLAKMARVSESHVKNIIRKLKKSGELSVVVNAGGEFENGQTNMYYVNGYRAKEGLAYIPNTKTTHGRKTDKIPYRKQSSKTEGGIKSNTPPVSNLIPPGGIKSNTLTVIDSESLSNPLVPTEKTSVDTGGADGSKTDSSKAEEPTSLEQKDVGTVKRETIPLRVLLKETRAKLNVHEPERPFGEREAEKIAAYNDSLKLKDVPPAVPMQYEICEQCLRRREIVAIIDDVPLCNECAAQVQNESVSNDTDSRAREKPKRKRSEKQQKQDRVVDALVETFEYTKPTKSDYSNLRGVAKELLEVGLTHEDIPALVQYVRQKESKGDWTVTARSLIGNGRVGRYIRWRDADKTKPIGTPAYSPNDSEIWSGGGDDAGK